MNCCTCISGIRKSAMITEYQTPQHAESNHKDTFSQLYLVWYSVNVSACRETKHMQSL